MVQREKIFTKNFCMIMVNLFFTAMVMYMLMTTIAEYASSYGATAAVAGLVTGIYVIGGLISRLYCGSGTARFGWRRIALAFQGLHLLACLGYFLSGGMVSLLLIRFFHGLGFGAGTNAILSIGTYTMPKSRYGEAMGYMMLPTTLSIAIGPFIGGIIYDRFGSAGCFGAAAVFSLLSFLSVLLINIPNDAMSAAPSAEPAQEAPRGIRRLLEPGSVPLSFCIVFLAIGYVAVMSFYRLYAAETGLEREFSSFFLFYAVVLLLVRPVAGMIQDRYGDNPACLPGIFLQAAGLLLVGWRPCMATIILCAVGCALGYGTLSSCLNAITSGHAPIHRRAFAVATFFAFCDAGIGVGPMVLGLVQTAAGSYRAIYYTAGLLALVAFPCYWLIWGRRGDTARKKRAS